MGVIHKPSPDWATFIPPLLEAMRLTHGPVLELGIGMFSTPLLHIICASELRTLVSYDNDGRFIEQFKNFNTRGHEIHFVEDWSKIDINKPWSVALVDHKPAIQRKEEIKRLVDTEYVVVHDTQERADEFYGFEEIYPLFRYRFDYDVFANKTTVLSNKHDVYNQFHSTVS